MRRNSLYLGSLFLLVALVIYFWESPESLLQHLGRENRSDKTPPYAIVQKASTRHFDKEGKLNYTFEAKTLRYFREEEHAEGKVSLQDYTEIEEPRLIIYHDGEPWLLEARYGKFTEENRHLLLWDEVLVSHLSDATRRTTMETSKLEIKPEERYAYTQEPVKIRAPSGEISAIGMIANFAEKQISLLSQVKGTHDPIL